MITSIRGAVLAIGAGFVTFEIGGLGVRVEVPGGARSPRAHVGESALLHTAFVVREDSLTLYGFETAEELEVFNLLITVSGVGPRSALGVLSTLDPGEVARAALHEDEKSFRKVSGIGPKTAKLLIISLAGKLDHIAKASASEQLAPPETLNLEQVVAALVGLGWSENEARPAAVQSREASLSSGSPEPSVQELIRSALSALQAPKAKK